MRAMRLLFGPASVLQMQANANSNDGNDVNLKVTNMHPTTCYGQSVSAVWLLDGMLSSGQNAQFGSQESISPSTT